MSNECAICGDTIFWERTGTCCQRCHPSPETPVDKLPEVISPHPFNPKITAIDKLMGPIWRGLSIPTWRKILIRSLTVDDRRAEAYASWMLRDVLNEEEPGI